MAATSSDYILKDACKVFPFLVDAFNLFFYNGSKFS